VSGGWPYQQTLLDPAVPQLAGSRESRIGGRELSRKFTSSTTHGMHQKTCRPSMSLRSCLSVTMRWRALEMSDRPRYYLGVRKFIFRPGGLCWMLVYNKACDLSHLQQYNGNSNEPLQVTVSNALLYGHAQRSPNDRAWYTGCGNMTECLCDGHTVDGCVVCQIMNETGRGIDKNAYSCCDFVETCAMSARWLQIIMRVDSRIMDSRII
jgi:hypothetical protein